MSTRTDAPMTRWQLAFMKHRKDFKERMPKIRYKPIFYFLLWEQKEHTLLIIGVYLIKQSMTTYVHDCKYKNNLIHRSTREINYNL